jgi:hypothetical protein
MKIAGRSIPWAAMLALLLPGPARASGPEYGVYLRLADGPAGSYQQMVAAVPALAGRANLTILASYQPGTPDCTYHATVFVLQSQAWTERVVATGIRSAFAAPIRLAVYEDELGVHLAMANPQSLARTIVAEDFDQPATEVVKAVEAAVAQGYPGTPVAQGYGQIRDRGLISRTMGIVAGGPFPSKIREIGRARARNGVGPRQVADALAEIGAKPSPRWDLHLVYRLQLPDGKSELLGFSGQTMEARSFAIVGSGGDDSRKGYACPGLDHAPAYPLELLVTQEGDAVAVLLPDVMFRMKMYFEDAGTMKFAANMAMPGSIDDELRNVVEDALASPLAPTAAR